MTGPPPLPLYVNASAPSQQYFRDLYLEILKAYTTLMRQYNILVSGNFTDYDEVLQMGSIAKSSVVAVSTDTGGGGTGFFITGDGCVVTNQHVVAQARGITVQLLNGTNLHATLVKAGDFPDVDLAVLKVDGSNYPSVTVTDSIPASGDTVFAVGQSADFGKWVISAGNFISDTNTFSSTGGPLGTLFISAPLGPGYSGSAVMTTDGRVIGVVKGDAGWVPQGISASDSAIVEAKNAGYYWAVGPSQATAVPSSTLLTFLQGTSCQPTTFIQSTTSSQTFTLPQDVTYNDVVKLYANYTGLMQTYKSLVNANSQPSQYALLSDAASKTKAGVVALDYVQQGQFVSGAGTGFVVSPNGCIVTNRHVVAKTAGLGLQQSQFGVEFVNGTKMMATLVKVANDSGPDLAILKVDGSGFKALPLNLTTPSPGAMVFTVGNPSRFGTWVTSAGAFAFAGKDFSGPVLKSSLPGGEGNSGSPMLNLNGAVVGVVWGGTLSNSAIGPGDSVVVWMSNAGDLFVRSTYVSAVPSQDLAAFLKDTPCQTTSSQPNGGGVSQGGMSLFALNGQPSVVLVLAITSGAALSYGWSAAKHQTSTQEERRPRRERTRSGRG